MPELEMSSCRAPRKFDELRHAASSPIFQRARSKSSEHPSEHGKCGFDILLMKWRSADRCIPRDCVFRTTLSRVCHFCQLALLSTGRNERVRPLPIVPPFASPFISRTRHSFCHVMPTLSSADPGEFQSSNTALRSPA